MEFDVERVEVHAAGGKVTIDVSAVDGHAELRVADTGMGIPTGSPFVFDKFRQAHASFSVGMAVSGSVCLSHVS